MRAGWRFLIYFAMFGFCFSVFPFIAGLPFNAQRPGFNPWAYLSQEVAVFLAALVPALFLGKLEGRTLGEYGLPGRQMFGRHFWEGMVWGIVSISLLIAALHRAHVFDYGKSVLHGYYLVKWAVFWGVFFLFVGLFEDFTFRGYTLFTLTDAVSGALSWLDTRGAGAARFSRAQEKVGFWGAAIVLSALFGLLHLMNQGETLVGGLAAGLIGLWFSLSVRRTGTLWLAIGFHLSFDWGETFLYSVPDSGNVMPGHLLSSHFHGPRWLTGGSVGPEGSVLVFGLIALLFVVFDRVHREAKYPRPDGEPQAKTEPLTIV